MVAKRLVLLFLAAFILSGCGGSGPKSLQTPDAARSVSSAEVEAIVAEFLSIFRPFDPVVLMVWPPIEGLPHCEFTHGPITIRQVTDELVEAEFDYSGKVRFEKVPDWEEIADGRLVLQICWEPVNRQWTTGGSVSLRAREVFGRPSDMPIPSLEIANLVVNGEGAPDKLVGEAPLAVDFSVSGMTPAWEEDFLGYARLYAADRGLGYDGSGEPQRSGNSFTVAFSAPPGTLGRYWLEVRAGSWKKPEDCMLPVGTRVAKSVLLTVAQPPVYVPIPDPPDPVPPLPPGDPGTPDDPDVPPLPPL